MTFSSLIYQSTWKQQFYNFYYTLYSLGVCHESIQNINNLRINFFKKI